MKRFIASLLALVLILASFVNENATTVMASESSTYPATEQATRYVTAPENATIIYGKTDETRFSVHGNYSTKTSSAIKNPDNSSTLYITKTNGSGFSFDLSEFGAGTYEICYWVDPHESSLSPMTLTINNGSSTLGEGTVYWRNGEFGKATTDAKEQSIPGGWVSLGEYTLPEGHTASVDFVHPGDTDSSKGSHSARVTSILVIPKNNEETPGTGEGVASINGTEYASLEEAIEAATDDATITLLDNCELPDSGYDEAITYDLNGYTLTCDAFTGINATVVDSSNGNKGLLKIPQDKLVFDINNDNDGYIPVWDSESEGYRFSSVTISDIDYTSTDTLVFAMRPAFDSSNIEELVAAGHETGKVRVGVRITWPGSDKPYDLPLSDDWLSTMYGGEIAKGVKLTISGGENITEFTATTIVWSEQCPYVVITGGETHTYQATVVHTKQQ